MSRIILLISTVVLNKKAHFGNKNWLVEFFVLVCCLACSSSLLAQSLFTGGGSSSFSSFVVTADNKLIAWGSNLKGQLGNGRQIRSAIPLDISNYGTLAGKSIVSVSSGFGHTLALTSDGTVHAWGNGQWGQLGNGNFTSSLIPEQVPNLSGIIAIAAGSDHSLALKSDGTVYAWGFGLYGQLGDGVFYGGETMGNALPVSVHNLTGITAIAAGGTHSLALKSDGTVYAWGNGQGGQLGTGDFYASFNPGSAVPVQVSSLSGITAIAGGWAHSLALKSDGTAYAWGDNYFGQLGIGIFDRISPNGSALPMPVESLTGISAISAGDFHSVALLSNGTVYAWGYGLFGQLGNGIFYEDEPMGSALPVPVNNLSEISAIAAGGEHSLALKSDGTVYAWGYGQDGQLGNGVFYEPPWGSAVPVQVSNLNLLQPSTFCGLTLTTKVTQAEPWYGRWGYVSGAGAIDLRVTGGTAPYTYQWNAGVSSEDLPTAVPGGFYSVVVTDANGCTGTTTTFVGKKNDFLRVLSSHKNVSTKGFNDGAIDLTVIGGVVPATYQWSNGSTTEDLTGLSAGTYKVIATDAFGRQATTTVIISEPGTPLSLSIAHQKVTTPGKGDGAIDVTVVGGAGPYTYRWNTWATTEDLHYALPGLYTLTVTDATGATATASVRVTVGRDMYVAMKKGAASDDFLTTTAAGLTAYPNPATERATVNFRLVAPGKYTLELYDLRGAKVKTLATGQAQANNPVEVEVNVADYAKGIYLLKLQTDKGVSSQRLMIER